MPEPEYSVQGYASTGLQCHLVQENSCSIRFNFNRYFADIIYMGVYGELNMPAKLFLVIFLNWQHIIY